VTYYNEASGAGSCSYLSSLFDQKHLLVAAAANFNVNGINAAPCGECVRIVVGNKQVVVKIVDQCPGCPSNGFDLSPYAFSLLANPSVGHVNACWQVVSCDSASTSSMEYWVKEGSSVWWFQLLVWNHRVPIAKFEVKPSGSSTWTTLQRTTYNYFDGSVLGQVALPLSIRVTSTGGEVIVDSINKLAFGNVVGRISTSKQFSGTGYSVNSSCGVVTATKSKTRSRTKSRTRTKSRSRSRTRTRTRTRSKSRTKTPSRRPL